MCYGECVLWHFCFVFYPPASLMFRLHSVFKCKIALCVLDFQYVSLHHGQFCFKKTSWFLSCLCLCFSFLLTADFTIYGHSLLPAWQPSRTISSCLAIGCLTQCQNAPVFEDRPKFEGCPWWLNWVEVSFFSISIFKVLYLNAITVLD